MKLGKYYFSQRAFTVFFIIAFLLGSSGEAFAFGQKPVDPPPPPPSTPAPSLKIDNPQGGQVYTVGKSVSITGKATGLKQVGLYLDSALVASSAASSKFSLGATFTAAQVGKRTLTIVGFDANKSPVVRVEYKVEVKALAPTLSVENLKDNQNFIEGDNGLFYIVVANGIDSVEISKNGKVLGLAEYVADQKKYRFGHVFVDIGAYDLKFSGRIAGKEMVSKTYRVNILAKAQPPPPAKNFNAYILKAVDKIRAEHGLRGYNIKAQLTHDLNYNGRGVLKSTLGELTMCVSASLEVILTAYEIYAKETGDHSIYDYLPYRSWNSLGSGDIKAHIWVDAKLDSYGTADALAHFGMGENVPFSELEPGSFINLNRENGTGHSVVFISYIDAKANELPRYEAAKVAGFKYFSAQGKEAKGVGGFDYRYAFFSKNGCPTISYHRDCGLMYSTNRKYLNTGMMWHPRDWRKPAALSAEGVKTMAAPEVSAEDAALSARPANFNGLTTDD